MIVVCKDPCFLCFRLEYLSFLTAYGFSFFMAIAHALAFFLVINSVGLSQENLTRPSPQIRSVFYVLS